MEKIANLDLKQKSRIKWAIDGDENTKVFHGYVNNNKRRNRINEIMINDSWNTNPCDIKQEALRFFKRKYDEKWASRPKLLNPTFKQLLAGDKESLEEPIILSEIKDVVWACGNEKSPGQRMA